MPFEEETGCFIATATYRTPTAEDEIKDLALRKEKTTPHNLSFSRTSTPLIEYVAVIEC